MRLNIVCRKMVEGRSEMPVVDQSKCKVHSRKVMKTQRASRGIALLFP